MSNSDYASKQLNKIRNRISAAAKEANRELSEISLIGAAKQQSTELVASFAKAGLRHIGENYLNQGLEKQEQLVENDFVWHFIGTIQSRKTKAIAQHFSWVHSIDRLKVARGLDKYSEGSQQLQVLLQINIDDEDSKGGISPSATPELCEKVSELENLKLRGFMLLPKARETFQDQRKPFAQARELLSQCNQRLGLNMDTLSMGMSNDLEAAILEGSTMIRVGTDLFGARAK